MMKVKSNIHTHTTFCDGKNTPEEMLIAAIDAGFDTIGFSGHAGMPFDDNCGMSTQTTEDYKREVRRLREKYRDKITVLLGIEHDAYSIDPLSGYDYVIGSVHYLKKDGIYIPIDYSANALARAIDDHYNKDADSFAEDYFSTLSEYIVSTRPTVIGHFDLLTKYSETDGIFANPSDRYRLAVKKALAVLLPLGIPFEVNTGAISRSYRTTPYPAEWILCDICRAGGDVIITSDAHSAENIAYAFDEAAKYIKSSGFSSVLCISGKGFVRVDL